MGFESLAHPQFKPNFHREVVLNEGLYLLSEDGHLHFQGQIYEALAKWLNGRHAIEEIFEGLRDRFSVHDVYGALINLRTRGVLTEGATEGASEGAKTSSPFASPQAAFWQALGPDTSSPQTRLDDVQISLVHGGGPALQKSDLQAWKAGLRAAGLPVERIEEDPESSSRPPDHPGPRLAIVLTDDYLHPQLDILNRRFLANKQPWLLVRPRGTKLWIGPWFVPGSTGCWECLAHRLRGHRRLETYLQHKTQATSIVGPPSAGIKSTDHTGQGLVATEVMRRLIHGQSPLQNAVVTFDWVTLESRQHSWTARPQCPRCGAPPPQDAMVPVQLKDDDSNFAQHRDRAHAGLRRTQPEATAHRLMAYVSPVTGIIGSLTPRLSEAAHIAPLFVTDHSFANMATDRFFLQEGVRKRSGGKGTSCAQAMASALGESIERYCGVFQGDEPRRTATLSQLGSSAIHPNTYMGFSERQYAHREPQRHAHTNKASWVPVPFDPERAIEWTPLWDLETKAPHFLPTACCYYGYPSPDETCFALANSNGCAAGNTLEEAVLQGLLELIERDAVAVWWYNRWPRPRVELDTFDLPYPHELVRYYETLNRELWVLDLTHDLGVPVFAAVSRRHDQPREDIILGFGAHFDPKIALLRAMTEVNQSLPSVPSVANRPNVTYRGQNHAANHWWQTATVAEQAYLLPSSGKSTYQNLEPLDPSEGLYRCIMRGVRQLSARGLQTLVLDQSRPDVELAVVRVVVPGLRHFWARFGPGRLYEVPVSLGWRDHPLPEEQLNEYVVYF